ncbi:MAG: IS1182 family transposase [Paracoccaceae bacterium]
MTHFIEGLDRQQTMLLPEHLDDYVDESNAVRAIDAFAEMLDLAALGFNAQVAATGRPSYHPGLMLRIYLYGYLKQVQSSRGLERECGRNLGLVWLTGRLKPDFKTIADFCKDNGPAIRKVCQQFVALCRNMDLLDGDVVAIDGSRFKAVNAKAKNYTRGKLRQKLGEIDKAIERYLGELDRADEVFEQTGTVLPGARMERTLRKLEHLQKEAVRYRSIEQRMDETGETQISFSDPDARSMATTARMPRIVGYNVQTAVEADHHLIVTHEVTMLGFDRDALSMMVEAARDAMTTDQLTAIADKGYYKGEEIVASEEAGISVVIPKTMTSNAAARGQFDKADFAYDGDKDVYVCPAGENLTYRFTGQQDGKAIRSYWSGACAGCAIKAKCTTSKERRVCRWEKEDVLERVQARLDADPAQLVVRSMTVEHPYATIKSWMGATHFKMRQLKNVATEMALHVLDYNMTRVMNIMGIPAMIAAMKA